MISLVVGTLPSQGPRILFNDLYLQIAGPIMHIKWQPEKMMVKGDQQTQGEKERKNKNKLKKKGHHYPRKSKKIS